MRVLVTGVSGFAGSIVAGRLARAGYDVVGLHRRDTRFLGGLADVPNVTLVHGDLAAAADLPGPFESIVHVAATSPGPAITASQIVCDNVDATRSLIDAALNWQSRRFIYFSSLSLYGQVSVPVVDEATPIVNPDVYGASKFLCEALLAERAAVLPSLSMRLPGVLGPGAHRNWLSQVAEKMLAGERIDAYHLDAPFNNAAHIDDIAKLIIATLGRSFTGADAVVLGAAGEIPVREALAILARGLGREPRINECTAPKPGFILSSRRAIERWGYRPMEIGTLIGRYAADALQASRTSVA